MKNSGQIIKRMFRKSLIVMILTTITATIGMVVDGMIIGKYLGVDAIAAYGIAMPAYIVITAVGGIIGSGVQTLCAGKMTQGKLGEANQVFSLACTASLAVSVLLMLLLLALGDPIARLLGAGGSSAYLQAETGAYLRGLAPGVPVMLLSFCLHPILQLDSDRSRLLAAVVVMTVVNILGDLVNVFVIEGGMFGMALATSVSYAVSLVVVLLHFKKKTAMYHFRYTGMDLKMLREMILSGLPTAVSRGCNTLRTLVLNNILMALSGAAAVAALSVQSNMNNLVGALGMGVGAGVLLISGVVVGEKDAASARTLMKTALGEGFVLSCIAAALLFAAAPLAVSLYIQDDPVTTATAVTSVRFFAVSMPFHLIGTVFLNFLQGSRNTIRANIITVFNEFGMIVLAVLVLVPFMGETGVWLALPVGKILMLPLIYGMVVRHLKRCPRSFEELLFLPGDFAVEEQNKLEASACEMDHVIELSENARLFCLEQGIDSKRAYYVALCIEEMAGNIIRYGFSDGKKHSIDLRLIVRDGGIVLRIRDDCPTFDPKKWLSIHKPEDPFANIGIRMVNSIARSFEYINTLSTNNLIIRL